MNFKKILTALVMMSALSTYSIAGNALSEGMVKEAKKGVKGITPQALKKKFDNDDEVYMLDIREPYMIVEGSIDSDESVEIPRGLLEFNTPAKIKNKNSFIVVYCRSGKAAPLAAQTLIKDLHYKNVVYLIGGINGWLNAGYSIYNAFGEMSLTK